FDTATEKFPTLLPFTWLTWQSLPTRPMMMSLFITHLLFPRRVYGGDMAAGVAIRRPVQGARRILELVHHPFGCGGAGRQCYQHRLRLPVQQIELAEFRLCFSKFNPFHIYSPGSVGRGLTDW